MNKKHYPFKIYTNCEDEDPKSDLNGQSRLFPRMHLGPQGRALIM